MLAEAGFHLRDGVIQAHEIALVGPIHMIAIRMAGVSTVSQMEYGLLSDRIPLCRGAAAGGGFTGKFPVAKHLSGQSGIDIRPGMLQITAKQVGRYHALSNALWLQNKRPGETGAVKIFMIGGMHRIHSFRFCSL